MTSFTTSATPQPTVIDAVRTLARVARLVERAAAELSPADYRVLSAIAGGEARASRLATRLALGKPTISASVDSLCRRGLLERSGVPGDSRATALSLTNSGSAVFAQAEGRMARQLEQLCERTPDGHQVVQSLCWLADAVEAIVAERRPNAPTRNQPAQEPTAVDA